MCQKKKKGGEGLTSIEDSVDTSIRWLEEPRKTKYSDQKLR